MVRTVFSAATHGIDGYIVVVETHLEGFIPGYATVGLPDNAVKESKERVLAAIKNSGFFFPQKRITINLAPADIRKEGSSYDLPIAIGILAASGQLNSDHLDDFIMLGEVSLEGKIRPIHGALSLALAAQIKGFKAIVLPEVNAGEAAMAPGIDVYGVTTLSEVVDFLNADVSLTPIHVDTSDLFSQHSLYPVDLNDVKGQDAAKRALEIAAAGSHNLVMIGPPGSGKTMLAKRFPTVLPQLTLNEALETTKIHSVAGILPPEQPLLATRPYRSPHHTISGPGLIGGGKYPRPGEVSMAHNGVLFLDELPEYKRNVLEVMRQPMEDTYVTIARAMTSITYPARFMLVAAMNPCPCGYYGDIKNECTCSPVVIQRYRARVSGPLMDRVDIHLEVPSVPFEDLASLSQGESSSAVRERVQEAREIQTKRFKDLNGIYANAHMTSNELQTYCSLDADGMNLLRSAIDRLGLSARAYDRILKVGRTIADLEKSDKILPAHVAEAIQYRSLDRENIM
ncbi:magnesium chelatase [candidate division LCP-89 bacterium B3_LCP]|uniref:Magnesium chelatase n=1 Tax=candidate division LCP-89 bacterium B3_LCP TaxID=2012998 RepID=A0A532V412_UNCL8|nr:MAG: magnesium chelatase [candidate division LCP-89 bacterium B3_LCP]